MTTSFQDLYKFIRYEIIRKDDPTVISNEDLELAVQYIVEYQFESGFTVSESQGNKAISPALSDEQKKLLILKTALSILIPEDSFSYRTASLSKFLEGSPGLEEQREDLRQRITDIESGGSGSPSLSDDEFGLYQNQGTRLADTISNAQANG